VSTPNEYEHLSDGLNSEFWKLFVEHVQREWGPSGLRYQQAVRDASHSANAVVELQKVLFAQDQVHALMRWPVERIHALRHDSRATETSASRRGPGL